jgi:acetyl-CoA synthetase
MNSEDSLFILYTSGATGKPKETVHVHGGFMMVAAQQTTYLIDMKASVLYFGTQILVGLLARLGSSMATL